MMPWQRAHDAHCHCGRCVAAAVLAPEWGCHQATQYPLPGVTLFKQPCFDQSLRLSTEDIKPYAFWYYYGTFSKQTTTCADKAADSFCWVKARTTLEGRVMEGWLPVARTAQDSKFVNSLCGSSAGLDEFVLHHCGEHAAAAGAAMLHGACCQEDAMLACCHDSLTASPRCHCPARQHRLLPRQDLSCSSSVPLPSAVRSPHRRLRPRPRAPACWHALHGCLHVVAQQAVRRHLQWRRPMCATR